MLALKLFPAVLVLVSLSAPITAQSECDFGSKEAADALTHALMNESSCRKAIELLDKCRWGSSADGDFASIVIDKCEKTFLPKLPPAERARYREERSLCAYEYTKQEGTIAISENYVCQADVAAEFAANPALAKQPSPRASFDCAKAKTSLEKAICADEKLGEADIVLGRAYKAVLNSVTTEDRPKMIALEKEWLRRATAQCKIKSKPLTPSQRACMRDQFEARFMAIDGCSVGGPDECLSQLSH